MSEPQPGPMDDRQAKFDDESDDWISNEGRTKTVTASRCMTDRNMRT